ncbi:hypothetical protein BGZ60DRAFT_534136 [Tricladium varicosporioides]|nr:hypothetical protein BGZ60DRAFT_534136 [Hymenoscyphus varicosporioides]
MKLNLLLKSFLTVILAVSFTDAARVKCSVKNCCRKRDLNSLFEIDNFNSRANAFHVTRALPELSTPDILKDHIVREVNKLPPSKLIYNNKSKRTASTAIWEPFKNARGYVASFSIGLQALRGCTALIIVGKSGVFAAHFFEDESMEPSDPQWVESLLKSGNKDFKNLGDYVGELSGQPQGGLSTSPEVFIVYPVASREPPVDDIGQPKDTRPAAVIGFLEGQKQYPQAYDGIFNTIQSIWPTITTIQGVPYYPLNLDNTITPSGDPPITDKERLDRHTNGRILFEFEGKDSADRSIRLHIESRRVLHVNLPTTPA